MSVNVKLSSDIETAIGEIRMLKEAFPDAQVVISVPVPVGAAQAEGEPEPEPAPQPADPAADYEVDASSKKSKKIKLRAFPSPSADGPTLAHGDQVIFLNKKEVRYGFTYLHVRTVEEAYMSGWVESIFLKAI